MRLPRIDRSADIARRAYTLYQQAGSHDGRAAQDWKQAEAESQGTNPPAEADAAGVAGSKPEPAPAAASQTAPEATTEPAEVPGPKLVARVHALYEELGRDDVGAVRDWEKAQAEHGNDKAEAEKT